jgi:hypothetical protein
MPASDITVSAEFELLPSDTYTIAVAPLSGGTVLVDKNSAPAGSTVTVTVEPDSGYVLKEGTLTYRYDGADYPIEDYTFVMPAFDVTVSAEFEPLYEVIVGIPDNGKVIVDAEQYVTAGTVISLTVEPDTGYVLKEGSLTYSYDGADHPIGGSGPDYTFVMPAFDVTVSAFFNKSLGFTIEGPEDETIAIITEHSTGGDSTDISWTGAESVTFTVDNSAYTADDGNLKWFLNETEIAAASGNSLTIYARHYIQRSYTITVMIEADGQWYSAEIPFKVTE